MAVFVKTKAAFNKTKAAFDKTQAMFLVFHNYLLSLQQINKNEVRKEKNI